MKWIKQLTAGDVFGCRAGARQLWRQGRTRLRLRHTGRCSPRCPMAATSSSSARSRGWRTRSIPTSRANCSGSIAPARARSGAASSGAPPLTATGVLLRCPTSARRHPGGLHAVSLATGERALVSAAAAADVRDRHRLQCRPHLGADGYPRRAVLRVERRRAAGACDRGRLGHLVVRHQPRVRDAQRRPRRRWRRSRVLGRPSPAGCCTSIPATAIISAGPATCCSRLKCSSEAVSRKPEGYLLARVSAVSSASFAGTSTSGTTPVPSQLLPLTGLTV